MIGLDVLTNSKTDLFLDRDMAAIIRFLMVASLASAFLAAGDSSGCCNVDSNGESSGVGRGEG